MAGQALLFAPEDLADIRIGVVKREAGAWPPPDGTIVVERSSVDFSGAALGSQVSLKVGEREPVVVRVSGIARDVGLAPGWMEHVVYGFATRATLAQIGAPASLNEIRFTVRDRSLDQAEVRRIAWQVKELVESTGRVVHDVDVPVPGEHIHEGQMNTLLYTQAAFGVLALLLSGFLVVNLISAMLAGQVREIGVMKAIGARPSQVAGMYLALALALGAVASAVSVPAAVVIGRAYGAFKAELLNFEVAGYAIPGWVIALQIAVGLALPVLAAAIPVSRGSRLSAAEALRDFGISATGYAPGGILLRVSGVTRPVLFSLRNAFRRRQRMALTLLALAMGGASFLGAANLRRSIRRGMDLAFAPRRHDFTVRLAKPADADSITRVAGRVDGVAGAEAWTGASAAVVNGDGTLGNAFPVTAPPLDTRMLAVEVTRGRWPTESDGNAIVMSASLLRDLGRAPGDTLTLMIGGARSRWLIVGEASGGIGLPNAYTGRTALAAQANGGLATTAVVVSEARGPASILDLIQRVRGELDAAGLAVASTSLVAESRRVVEDHLLTVAQFLGAMAWVLIVVGGLGLASTMSLAVLERTREIGVLRAIGARHRSVLAIVLVEGLVIGVLGWLIAIPLAAPISAVLALVFGRTMMAVPVTWIPDLASIGIWLGLVIVVSVVATALPALMAMRVPTGAALSYE
jgi:putative ABC transport system permease protein